MKLFKKHLHSFLLIFVVLISCEEQPQPRSDDGLRQLTNQSLASEDFKTLNVSLSQLNTGASAFVNAKKNSIFIPFHGSDERRGIIALFSDAKTLRTIVEYNVVTDVPANEVYGSLTAGTFTGTFLYRTPQGEIELKTERSKIVSTATRISSSGRISGCNYITESGGALDCAGSRLLKMNYFEKALCYIEIVPCMVELSISCWIDGCS